MTDSVKILHQKIDDYKVKYYKNLLVKGVLFTLGLILTAFLAVNLLEYFGRFNSFIRGVLFFSFVVVSSLTLLFWIIKPLLFLLRVSEPISNENAAKEIGRFFPEIGDKLLNTLQLSQISDTDNSLLQASISQKTSELKFYKFADVINLNNNKKYLKYILPPLLVILLIGAVSPTFFKKNTERIVYFQKEFAEDAPFKFIINNEHLKATKNEDFVLKLSLIGNTIPESVFLVANGRRFKMEIQPNNTYSYTFSKVQSPTDFHFLASGFQSNQFTLELTSRPSLLSFGVNLTYPNYLNKASEHLDNVGNLVVPEGTIVQWTFKTSDTDSVYLSFDNNRPLLAKSSFGDKFIFSQKFKNSSFYKILLLNEFSMNRDDIDYYINVIPDKYPQIQLEQVKDTTLFNYIVVGGNISDDYGLSAFKLFYRIIKADKPATFSSTDISFNRSQISQSYYYHLPLDNLQLKPEDKIEYYLQVWDNDGTNGHKSTKTPLMTFALPSTKNLERDVEKEAEKTESMIEKLLEKSRKLKENINELDNRLKSKKTLDFQEKKQLDEMLKKRNELLNELKALQQQFEQMQEKNNRFQQQSPEIQQKMEQLRKLMNELLNEESNKLYEDLKKMLEKNLNENALEQLEKIKNQDRNLDKDIDRTLKLMKQMQLQQKVEKQVEKLEQLAEKQEQLADDVNKNEKESNQTEKSNKSEELEQKQQDLSNQFKEQQEDLKEIDNLSKELKKEVDTDNEEQKDISNEQKNAEQQLNNKQNSDAAKSQKNAAKKMKSMAAKMKASMASSEMKQLDEDLDALRAILENLVSLSFDQEKLMKEFRNINLSDPRFIQLSQNQLKLQDDAKIVEDSLYSLAKRVMQIQSVITREVTTMKNSMDESVKFIKDRKLNIASAKQQFSMTSINNLALMLSDVFKQMQEMMAAGSGSGKNKSKSKLPSMSQMQDGMNKKMEKIGNTPGGMSGDRKISEELAKLAQEQSRVRKLIQQMQDDLKGTELGKKMGGDLKEMEKKADEIETELVNKRLTPELIKRSRELQVRLLEAEKAKEQQEEDPTRQSKTASTFSRPTPPQLEKYFQSKQKQMELIRTVPPNYTPFYKKETDSYFRKIK